MSDREQTPDANQDRAEIRRRLSEMSFENLQKLKETLGSKVYNEAAYGAKKTNNIVYTRENKNRPRETSSKKQTGRSRDVVAVKKNVPRDPRFDGLCGTFSEKAFKNAYSFVEKLKEKDLEALEDRLKNSQDPKEINKIKYLARRIQNQLREETRHRARERRQIREKHEIADAIKSGEKPRFKKKSEKKILDLVSQYEDLKNSGKLTKHIRRLRKKNINKDRKKFDDTDD